MNALVNSGVDHKIAESKVEDMLKPAETTLLEQYGRGGISRASSGARRNLNVKGLGALDLRTEKPDNTGWDFSRRDDRLQAREMVNRLKPDFMIGGPPCAPFCTWSQCISKPIGRPLPRM